MDYFWYYPVRAEPPSCGARQKVSFFDNAHRAGSGGSEPSRFLQIGVVSTMGFYVKFFWYAFVVIWFNTRKVKLRLQINPQLKKRAGFTWFVHNSWTTPTEGIQPRSRNRPGQEEPESKTKTREYSEVSGWCCIAATSWSFLLTNPNSLLATIIWSVLLFYIFLLCSPSDSSSSCYLTCSLPLYSLALSL